MPTDGFRNADTEPLTEDLLDKLMESPSIDDFHIKQPQVKRDLSAYLNGLLALKDAKRIDVIHAANLNETFGYQIFTGDRNPSRDKVLALCFALQCSFKESQRMLWHADVSRLYLKNRRDAIISYCLLHGYGLDEADDELYRLSEATIQSENA